MALGSNLGDRWWILQGAVQELSQIAGHSLLSVSPVWETSPWGVTDQPPFLNAVAALEIQSGSPEGLLEALQSVEILFGRTRTTKWGPRTLDLDLLAWDDESRDAEFLQLPHPSLWERSFVTTPLAWLLTHNQSWQHPWLVDWRRRLTLQESRLGPPAGHIPTTHALFHV